MVLELATDTQSHAFNKPRLTIKGKTDTINIEENFSIEEPSLTPIDQSSKVQYEQLSPWKAKKLLLMNPQRRKSSIRIVAEIQEAELQQPDTAMKHKMGYDGYRNFTYGKKGE